MIAKLTFVYIGEVPGKVPRAGDSIKKGDIMEIDLKYAGDFLNDPQNYCLKYLKIFNS